MADWFKNVRDRYQGAMAVPQTDMATKLARTLAGLNFNPQNAPPPRQVTSLDFAPRPPPLVQTNDFLPQMQAPPVTVQASPMPPPAAPAPPAMPPMDAAAVPPMQAPQQVGPMPPAYNANLDPRYLPEQWRGSFNLPWSQG